MRRVATVGALGIGAACLGLGCGARTTLDVSGDVDTTAADGMSSAGPSAGSTQTSTTGNTPKPQRELDKLDILLSVDDSVSMADKQLLLKAAVPDLIGRLANPLCVDASRREFPELTPAAGEACPRGPSGQLLEREFLPVSDLHVGVVTSTMGAGGANGAPSNLAHLLGSFATELADMVTPQGFLAWDPGKPQAEFEREVQAMTERVGENGSGYEAPLEAWYRFLVEPAPYDTLAYVPCSADDPSVECVVEQGLDTKLLEQRRAFLRPDSVLVIIVLSDEDDCSARIEGTNWQYLTKNYPLEFGTAACNTDPNDPCCAPCGAAPAPGCEVDPSCSEPREDDDSNLLCFEPKRRYGRDALLPIERYKRALTERELCTDHADLADTGSCSSLVDNPLFVDLERGGPAARTPEAVFLTFIVGVPWHDLATRPLDLLDPNVDGLVYKSAAQMDRDGTWDLLLGSTLDPPGDPLMLQSVDSRSGTHPITGETIAGSSAWPVVNSINGHDRTIAFDDDLQYACTFPLPEVRDCAGKVPCDCSNPRKGTSYDNPMCQDPNTGEYTTWQHSGKAYPGQRHAALARELGDNAVLSSICARNTDDPTRADYAYRPTVAALVTRIAPILQQPE